MIRSACMCCYAKSGTDKGRAPPILGPTDAWHDRYGNGQWRHYDQYKDSGYNAAMAYASATAGLVLTGRMGCTSAFVVEGGSLGFNTMIFSILTCFVFLFLFLRRYYVGGM